MLTVFWSFLLFILALTLLIGIHEFGHFIIARILGVKVLRFSIGFGKPILRYVDRSGTEYVLASIPLGGYVKMLDEMEGEVPPQELHLAFNRKPLWIRTAVVVAGPLFNILFAIVAYWLMFVHGINDIMPVIGDVTPNSIASAAGLQANDEILSINNKTIHTLSEANQTLINYLGDRGYLSFKIRNSKGEISTHSLNLADWHVNELQPKPLQSLGILPFEPNVPPVVSSVVAGSPAEIAGLKNNDQIVAINKQKVLNWQTMRKIVNQYPNQKINITIIRDKRPMTLYITPLVHEENDQKVAYLGVMSSLVKYPAQYLRVQKYSVISAWVPAMQRTWRNTKLTFHVLEKMIVGNISLRSISGPIGIAQGAGLSASFGLSYFLDYLALVSISLGVLNILPIPVLDGGHLLFYSFELVSGKPASREARELGLRIGIILLLALALLAFFNDLNRILS